MTNIDSRDLHEQSKNDKYVVFPAFEFYNAFDKGTEEGSSILRSLAPHVIEDGVVIRRQDRFAANAFDTYADQIQALVELYNDHHNEEGFPVDQAAMTRLLDIAEFFRDQANLSRRVFRKLPD